jgi:hypothetical protein
MIEDAPIPIKMFCKIYKWPTESAMRSYIFRKNENGLKDCFIKVGRRILVHPKKFFNKIRYVK